jgi:hypothetical protein
MEQLEMTVVSKMALAAAHDDPSQRQRATPIGDRDE